ncbi:hypothetical protein N8306_03810 [Yoonia sp.]|nr:hypothetical protein [Yoonia sp.]
MVGKIVTAGASLVFLTACGGGSSDGPVNGGGGLNGPVLVEVLATEPFPDGSGFAKARDSDGATILVVATEIEGFVAALGTRAGAGPLVISAESFPNFETLSETNAILGRGSPDGGATAVLAVDDRESDASMLLIKSDDLAAFLTSGPAFGALPSGSFTYSGTLLIGRLDEGPNGVKIGRFDLVADFDDPTGFNISGTAGSYVINGDVGVDPTNGAIFADNLSLTGSVGGASVRGQFHGAAAESVAGVIYSNEVDPLYAGAFVGSR